MSINLSDRFCLNCYVYNNGRLGNLLKKSSNVFKKCYLFELTALIISSRQVDTFIMSEWYAAVDVYFY